MPAPNHAPEDVYIPLPGVPTPDELAAVLAECSSEDDRSASLPGISTPHHLDKLLADVVVTPGVWRIDRATKYAIDRMMERGPETGEAL